MSTRTVVAGDYVKINPNFYDVLQTELAHIFPEESCRRIFRVRRISYVYDSDQPERDDAICVENPEGLELFREEVEPLLPHEVIEHAKIQSG